MTTAAARPPFRFSRIFGAFLLLAAVLAGSAFVTPQADAAKQKRVVAISPFAAEAIVQMGAKKNLVAVGQTIGASDHHNKLIRGIPKLKLSHPNGPNLEVMAKLKPDVVFSSDRWAAGTKALNRLGIRVVYADPEKLGQVKPSVSKIGRVLGKGRQAAALNRRISKSFSKSTRPSTKHPKVLVVLGIGNTAMAFLHNSWGGQLVDKAQANLVTGGAKADGGFARLSDEVVVAQNPDIIIVVPHGNSDDIDQVYDYIMNNDAWQSTTAVEKGKVFVSIHNELLQAGTNVGSVISGLRTKWLKNW